MTAQAIANPKSDQVDDISSWPGGLSQATVGVGESAKLPIVSQDRAIADVTRHRR